MLTYYKGRQDQSCWRRLRPPSEFHSSPCTRVRIPENLAMEPLTCRVLRAWIGSPVKKPAWVVQKASTGVQRLKILKQRALLPWQANVGGSRKTNNGGIGAWKSPGSSFTVSSSARGTTDDLGSPHNYDQRTFEESFRIRQKSQPSALQVDCLLFCAKQSSKGKDGGWLWSLLALLRIGDDDIVPVEQ